MECTVQMKVLINLTILFYTVTYSDCLDKSFYSLKIGWCSRLVCFWPTILSRGCFFFLKTDSSFENAVVLNNCYHIELPFAYKFYLV